MAVAQECGGVLRGEHGCPQGRTGARRDALSWGPASIVALVVAVLVAREVYRRRRFPDPPGVAGASGTPPVPEP